MAYNIFGNRKEEVATQSQQTGQTQPAGQAGQTGQAPQAGQAGLQMPQGTVVTPQPAVQPRQLGAVDPTSATSGMDALSAMYTSPEQEEKLRKASVANRRILAVADALRHMGNIYHTVKYAPSQQFNNPVAEEQARYENGKAVRDAANLRYYTYQQQKDAQDAKARRYADELDYKNRNLSFRERQEARYRDIYGLNVRKQEHKESYDDRILELKEMHENGIITKAQMDNAIRWYNAKTQRMRAENGGSGGGEWSRTSKTIIHRGEDGKETGRETTIQRTNARTGENSTTTVRKTTNQSGGKSGNKYGGKPHGQQAAKATSPQNKKDKFGVKPAK